MRLDERGRASFTLVTPDGSVPVELAISGREVYVHTPDGYANAKLTGTYLERHLGVSSTTRSVEA